MTDEQRRLILRLSKCTFLPGSYEKRFVRSMAALANSKGETELSEKQAAFLAKVGHRYRRQLAGIPDRVSGE